MACIHHEHRPSSKSYSSYRSLSSNFVVVLSIVLQVWFIFEFMSSTATTAKVNDDEHVSFTSRNKDNDFDNSKWNTTDTVNNELNSTSNVQLPPLYCEFNSSRQRNTVDECFQLLFSQLLRVSQNEHQQQQPFQDNLHPAITKDTISLLLQQLERKQQRLHWMFMGDSNMFRLYDQLIESLRAESERSQPNNNTHPTSTSSSSSSSSMLRLMKEELHKDGDDSTKNKRCTYDLNTITEYLPPARKWLPPNYTNGEGPVARRYTQVQLLYDKVKPFCHNLDSPFQKMEYTRRISRLHIDNGDSKKVQQLPTPWQPTQETTPTTNMTIEFVVSAFAQDVEIPSLRTKTTQETLALYIQQSYHLEPQRRQHHAHTLAPYEPIVICCINAGLHDMTVPDGHHKWDYVRHVKHFLDLLQHGYNDDSSSPSSSRRCCSIVLWITISSTMDSKKHPQRNRKVIGWNHAVLEMISIHHPKVVVLDVYDESTKWKHVDNVHMIGSYYRTINQHLFEPFFLS